MKNIEFIKELMKDYIKTETESTCGKVNLISGILLAILVILLVVPNTLLVIMQCFFPKVELLMPWYGVLIMFGFLIAFFLICIRYVSGIELNREKGRINNLNDN